MGLSAREKKMLEALQQKAEAPDAPPVSRSLHVNIDAGDKEQREWAIKMGLLESSDFDDDDPEPPPPAPDDKPKRKSGFFGDEE